MIGLRETEQKLIESEKKYHFLTENINDLVTILNEKGAIEYINEEILKKILGYSYNDIMNKNVFLFVHQEDLEKAMLEFKKSFETGESSVELRVKNKEGFYKWTETKGKAFLDNDDKIKVLAITRDITERKKAEEALRESEKWLKDAQNLGKIGYWEFDLNTQKILWSDQVFNLYKRDRTLGPPTQKEEVAYYSSKQSIRLQEYAIKAINYGQKLEYDLEANLPDGSILQLSATMRPIKNRSGRVTKLIGTLQDITARKITEKKLKESEEKYRYLFDNAQVGLYWSRISDGKILECNDTFAKLFGYDSREDCLANYNTIEHYIDPNARSEILEEIRDNKEVKNYEIHVTKRDGTPIWLSISARMFEKENRIEGAAIDITERKKTEQKLKENTEFTQNIFNAIQDGLSVLDLDLNIVKVNPYITERYGSIDQILNRKCYDVYQKRSTPCPWCPSINTIETGQMNTSIVPVSIKENLTDWIELTAFPLKNSDGIVEGVIEYIKDITARKKAEEKLQLERDNFLNILNSMEDGVYIVNKNYDIEYLNPSLIEEFGQIEGKKCFKYFEDRNEPCPRCKNKEVLQGKTVKGEWFSFKNQKTYDVIDTPLKNPDGSISKLEIFRDISEKKKAENNFRKIVHQWRTTFGAMSESVFLLDLEKKILQCNKATLDILGKEKYNEIIGHSCCEIIHGTNEPVEWCPMKRMIESSHKESSIAQIGDRWCEISVDPVINDEGILIGAVHVIKDITERRKTEQKLIESEEKFRTIAERTHMGILIIQENQVKYVNDALLNMFGYSQKEIANWEMDDLTKLIHSEDLQFLRENPEIQRSSEQGEKPYPSSLRVFAKSGKKKWIDQFSKEILYRGRPAELVTIIDITEKKEVEHELIKLNNLKSELLRRTSHELRTPLVSIKGFSDLLLELHRDKLDDYVIRTIEHIRMGCNRLESLVDDILKTAELESGTVELKKSKENLSLLIKICVRELEGLSELRNHTINLKIPDNLICSFEKKQIYNVITNILSNAIKFTPYNGKIEVKSEINNDFIIVSIKDNGIGFTEEERSLIFKQFGKIERYGQGYDVISEGSGLGLYISKKIVELHGGEIWLESEGRDKGSTFRFSLPII